MTLTTVANPQIYLAADLGSSASKFFYRLHPGQTVPLWMGAEVADGLSAVSVPSLNASGRPQDSAWLQLDDEIVLVGDAAKAFLETNSLMAKKSQMAAYKIAAVLGAIATAEELPTHYDATVWLALPLTEIRTRNEVAEQLQSLCQSGFKFRDTPQRIGLSLKFFPEGFGLYLRHKQQLESLGQSIAQRCMMVLMMGHRNLSALYFEGGSLRVASSSSNGPGFWPVFEKTADSLGVTTADYGALMNALMTGRNQQISQSRGSLYDFGELAEAVQQTYWQAVQVHLQDHVFKQLGNSTVDITVSGGASHVLRSRLEDYFDSLNLTERVTFADGSQSQLTAIASQLTESAIIPTLPLRMVDCYGLFQGLIGKLCKVTA
ncbi:MAG: hypothetical protein AAGI45_02250 [Cyanobacteria bacterium P01_H01_bin.26]